METKDYEYLKLINEFGQIPFVVKFKNLIESAKVDKNENLKFWEALVVEIVMSDKESKLKQSLYIWFMATYFPDYKVDYHDFRKNNSKILDTINENNSEIEILKRRQLHEYCLRFISEENNVDFIALKDEIEDKLSALPNKRSLLIEKRIVTKIEREKKILEAGYLKSNLTKPCLSEIHEYLNRNGLTAPLKLWLAWFGYEENVELKPMKWMESPQRLVNILNHICDGTNRDKFKKAFNKEDLPNAHTDYLTSAVCIAIESKIQKYK